MEATDRRRYSEELFKEACERGLGCANRNAVQKGNVQGSLGRNDQKHVGNSEGLQEQLREWWRQVEVDAGIETKQARAQRCCTLIFLVRRSIKFTLHAIVN